ncbi:hypothetical protein K7X08_029954 [Anisodus acutangulus]|uniref:AP2/ERF domain-containing protein n=1 Tax=Anisodus acutangulus TaxID=402998 RepID=A0A9Q1R337_9SOLA|nr:hypothetical protein K7X08_029954 [Anisodus acutangulus]
MAGPSHSTKSRTNTKHPIYRGIRCRSGKWVSEIREPRKSTRIWLGTYPTPQMAGAAYDVAALALKGSENVALNFPHHVNSYPKLSSSASPVDIQLAAATAAEMMTQQGDDDDRWMGSGSSIKSPSSGNYAMQIGSTQMITNEEEFVDEEVLFDFPSFLVNMAEAMMLSPPRINSSSLEDYSPGDFDAQNLWSYKI